MKNVLCCGRQAEILLPSVVSRIHPKDKQDVAHRLILGARSVAYGEVNVTFQGPFPQRITLSAADVVINYDQTLSVTLSNSIFEVRLMAEQRQSTVKRHTTLTAPFFFFISIQICCSKAQQTCESSSKWVKVPAKRRNDTEVVLHPAVCPPSEVVSGLRYAWRDWPCDFKACPVYSASSALPAPPFISHRYEADGITWQDDANQSNCASVQ